MIIINIVSNSYLGQDAAALAVTIGAAIIVGVLGLPPTAITWCGPGEPSTYTITKITFLTMETVMLHYTGSKWLYRSDVFFVIKK